MVDDYEILKQKSDNCIKLLENHENTSFEKKRDDLLAIEEQIRLLIGNDADNIDFTVLSKRRTDLLLLLDQRRILLNWMFRETNEEVMRMRLVNNRIHELVNSIRAKMADVCEWLVSHQRDCFEDDFEVEGTLKFSYNGDDSLLSYEGANVYGSDYRLMIAANNCLTGDDPFHFIELHCRYTDSRESILQSGNLDDEMSWAHETPGNFDGIYIHYCTACACRDWGYAIQDVLQLDDYWAETHLRIQKFGTLDKN